MTREEVIKWLESLKREIGKAENRTLWHYAESIDMAIETLSAKSEQTIRHIENNAKESDFVYRPSADDTFCKSQLITCNRVKECNGVCPFEDALQHADKTQTRDEQHTINHDREWIIGCIEHDGFIHTHRFDKANQIIHDALSADAVQVVRCKDCLMTKERDEYTGKVWCCRHREYMDDMYYCADGLRREDGEA